jgi:hypothetical protein
MKTKLSTNQKLLFLQKHMNKWCERWVKIHPENISGFRIDKKITGGKICRRYAIIFHVVKKIHDRKIKNEKLIPPYFKIRFPDGITRIVSTDVEQTGRFHFHLRLGSEIISALSARTSFGSAGLYLTDASRVRTFVLTNYHVAAWNLMKNNQYFYRRSPNQNQNNAQAADGVQRIPGRVEIGEFSNEVDAAFIELPIPPGPLNSLPNGQYVNTPIEGPYPVSLMNRYASVFSSSHPNGIVASIASNSSPFNTNFHGIVMRDVLLLTPPVTNHGDSGSIVTLTNDYSILGIVTGGDDKFTYVIPYYKINQFFPLTIL